ncbi:MAG: fibronectin type III domain-containing protein [Caldilineaceae bacterium]|nr:fibronectin type III domain-containing protein [Caldilineaceae bacterium]
MKQTTRLLALSALVLALMLGVFGAPALEAPSVAFAQGQVPAAPTGLTATRSGASTINLSWNAVTGAVRYQVYYWTEEEGFQRLDGGADNPHTTTTFAHQNVVADRLYVYQVYGVNSDGNRGPRSNRANEVGGQNAPGRPVLRPTPGYLLNVIEWDAVPGAVSYRLYAWDQSWSQVGGTITGTSYTHPNLTAGQTYYYEARAVDSRGVLGAVSAQVSATVQSSPTITAPVNLQASLADQQTTLTWQAPPGAGTTITGYEYRYAESTATLPATWSDAGNDLTETITGLTNGTQYTFEVRAVSNTGMGPPARVMQTPADEPDAPVLTATEGYRLVTLSWEAPEDNGAAITAYHVERLNAQNEWVAIPTSLSGSDTSYTHRGLSDSTVYTYRIFAQNAAGRSSASNSADATTLAQPAQAPGPPVGLAATSGPGKITIVWQAPLFNGGSPITRYEYRYKEHDATSFGGWMSAMTELTVEVMPLKPVEEYDFEVRAVNSAGAGDAIKLPPDEASRADTSAARTTGPTGPTAVPSLRTSLGTHAGTNADEGHESNAQITVSWNALPATANGGSAITGYELCYKMSTDSAWMRWDATADGFGAPTPTGSVYNAVHGDDTSDATLLDPGTIYQYRARAYNAVDGVGPGTAATCEHWDGAWSTVVSAAMTPFVKPNAPTLHPAGPSTPPAQTDWALNVNSITIRWTAPTADGGRDITSYEVWMGTATVTDADEIAALKPTVTNLPASRLEYISIGLRAETQYFYRVRARNGSGDNYVGAWSAEQAGTTTVTQAGTPGAPAITSATPGADGNVVLVWTAPDNQGTSPITSYEVQYQRTDDGGDTPGTEDTDDAGDWGDAVVGGTPTPPTALTWTHMQAPGLSTFVYRVRAVNGSGPGAWSDDSDSATVVDRAPAAPVLTATAVGSDEIMLQWNIPQGNGTTIAGFAIQQWDPDPNNDGNMDDAAWGGTNLLTTGGPTDDPDISDEPALTVFIVDDGLEAGTKYYFRIQALQGGTWSTADGTMAGAASATTMAGVPSIPVIAAAQTTNEETESLTVTWTAPNNGGSEILGYQIRVWDGSDWALESNLGADATMYKDEDLAPGERYYYILAARNSMGYGKWSVAASEMTEAGAPEAPTLNAIATGTDSIQLTWNKPKANGATITGYELQRWDNGDPGAWTDTNLLGTDPYTLLEFVNNTGLAAATKYYYRIRATVPTGDTEGTWSTADGTMAGAASATTHGDTPGRPDSLTVGSATASGLTLTWAAPTESGGSAITGYEVQVRSGMRWVEEATPGATATTYADTGLAAGTRYYYRVRAVNSEGGGLWIYANDATTAGTPDAPVLTATATGMTTIRLTWTVPNDMGTPITGYRLERWNPDSTPANWATDIGPASDGNLLAAGSTVTLFVDTERDPGMTYYYRIQTVPASGWSTIKSATTDPGRPGRPATVTATADGQNAIDITWTAAPANGSAIVRYELQVWNPGTSVWDTVRNDLPSTRLSYKHTGLTAGTKYVYRVRGVNRAADNNGLGRFSTIKFATTAE